jgi:hypothetical protein
MTNDRPPRTLADCERRLAEQAERIAADAPVDDQGGKVSSADTLNPLHVGRLVEAWEDGLC